MEIRILLTLVIVISNLWVLLSLDNNADNGFLSPIEINTDKHFFGAFGNCETEISARWIVRFCQKQRSWKTFTRKDLTNFYVKELGRVENFWLNGLDKEKYLTEKEDYMGNSWIKITPRFIALCWESTR